ncbi:MAG: OmpP1/FadL family transporter [Muribaculaceae bacterium]
MKKSILGLAMAALSTFSITAGGLLTNTNQNAAFLRQLSQEAIIDITGAYMNPAGIAFLSNGFHLSLNVQGATQDRDITTTFPLFAYNVNNPSATHKFEGEAKAPAIPSFQFAYVHDKWTISSTFALIGGGGKCEFDNGLGTFEALYASQIYSSVTTALNQVNQMANQMYGVPGTLAFGGYSINSYMKGRQYFFGLSLGGSYKITDNLAAFVGVRGVLANCNYNGWVEDASARIVAGTSPVDAQLLPVVQAQVDEQLSKTDISLNTDQSGFGLAPIIGIDWKINDQWNVAAKYEFKTRMRLKNKSEMNDYAAALSQTNAVLGQFADGSKVASDMPAFFSVGAQYSPISSLRFNAGYHFYDDCHATQYGDKQDLVDGGTFEVLAGVEYDICKLITVSAGWQTTNYDLSDEHMNDLSFTTSSNSVGGGIRIHASQRTSIDLGYMQTLYKSRDVATQTAAGIKNDHYYRTNRVFGVGVNIAF